MPAHGKTAWEANRAYQGDAQVGSRGTGRAIHGKCPGHAAPVRRRYVSRVLLAGWRQWEPVPGRWDWRSNGAGLVLVAWLPSVGPSADLAGLAGSSRARQSGGRRELQSPGNTPEVEQELRAPPVDRCSRDPDLDGRYPTAADAACATCRPVGLAADKQ
jgi:hypothetical protein